MPWSSFGAVGEFAAARDRPAWDSQVGARICNGLGIMRASMAERQRMERERLAERLKSYCRGKEESAPSPSSGA
jgi:hypothetical protein